MRLPFLRPKTAEAEPPRERKRAAAKGEPLRMGDDDVVAAARTRARRRLVGAVVLLAIGVIGFPILFDTQPRPLPLDTPIETPRREGTPVPAAAPRTRPSPVTTLPPDAGAEVAVAQAPIPSAPAPAASKPAAESTVAAVKPPAPVPVATPAPAPASTAAAGRFVVQVGAYTDAATLREARAKVEKLGLKTYTQVIEGEGGKPRTRVRLGPYATREDADAAASKLKRAGLPAAILTL